MSGRTPLTPGAVAILILDDVGVRRQAYRILSEAGYQILEAATNKEADDVLASWGDRLPLVIVDAASPSYNGLQLCEHVREQYSNVEIMMTLHRSERVDAERLRAARVKLIAKPIAAADLTRMVEEILM